MKPAVKVALRWVMLVALLVLAVIVALGPRRDSATDPAGAAAPTDPAAAPADPAAGLAGPAADPVDPAAGQAVELSRLRAAAALRPCPSAPSPAPAGSPAVTPADGPLSGVELPCLGAPGTVHLAAALAGRPALLNLWGPLCQPCAEEIPALAAYAAEPEAIPVLGVEVQQLPEGALDMLAQLDVHYPSVSDPEGALRAALGAPPVLPLSYVVSADGRVSQVNPPVVLRSPQQVRAVVEHYLDLER